MNSRGTCIRSGLAWAYLEEMKSWTTPEAEMVNAK